MRVGMNAGVRVAAVLRTVSWIAALLGLYLTGLGVTARVWVITGCGAAVLLLAVVIRIAEWVVGRVPLVVKGVGVVLRVSARPAARLGSCDIVLSVTTARSAPVTNTVYEVGVPVEKWPVEGQSLPVLVTLSRRARIRVVWDQVPCRAVGDTDPVSEDLDVIFDTVQPWESEEPLVDQSEPMPAPPDYLLDPVDVVPDEPIAPSPRRPSPRPRP